MLVTGCGGSGSDADPALESYFSQMEAAADRYNQRLIDAEAASESGIDPDADGEAFDAELLEALKRLFADGVVITRDFVNELSAIQPPADVTTEHFASVTTGEDLVAALEELGEGLASVDQLEVFQIAVAESRAAEVIVEFDRACIVLEAVAVDNGLEVQLNCGG